MATTSEENASKLALLIASPWGGLKGPLNDARLVEGELTRRGFEIIACYGEAATQEGILGAWNSLVSRLEGARGANTASMPAVVIYFSGHGGLVKPPPPPPRGRDTTARDGIGLDNRREYQYLVPYDFECTRRHFNGIMDIQIAHLLSRTTNQTRNVTVILDCCHSGRMARDPLHPDAKPKGWPPVTYERLEEHVERLREQGQLEGETHTNGNPHAVRLAAAATAESAFEYKDEEGQYAGVLTKQLVAVLRDAAAQSVSWRTALFRVRELVSTEFPQQHPHVEGPAKRFLFSTVISNAVSHPVLGARGINGRPAIQAGRLAGVKEGNVYTIMPPGFEQPDETARLCRATVLSVDAVSSQVEFTDELPVPYRGALAFLDVEALYRWPASCPEKDAEVEALVRSSKYLRPSSPQDRESPLVRFFREHGKLRAYDRAGVLLSGGRTEMREVVGCAETLARGHHMLTLEQGSGSEALDAPVEIIFGLYEGEALPIDGSAVVSDGDKIHLSIENRCDDTKIYVSVFNISHTGKVAMISSRGETGIPIAAGRSATVPESFAKRPGLKIWWPDCVPKGAKLCETLMFVITSGPVDLRHLDDAGTGYRGHGQPQGISKLEHLTQLLAAGTGRPIEPDRSFAEIRYDVLRLPFSLDPGAQA